MTVHLYVSDFTVAFLSPEKLRFITDKATTHCFFFLMIARLDLVVILQHTKLFVCGKKYSWVPIKNI